MSVQIFVRGKLLGIRDFLVASASGADAGDDAFFGRTGWISLLSEILPRALLAEFGLARILLGTSGGDQFLVVLPSELRERAEEFLAAAADDIAALSGSTLKLVWGLTENLGDFSDIRKRLNEELARKQGTPAGDAAFFASLPEGVPADDYFIELASRLRTSPTAGWSPETPGRVLAGEGKHVWPIDGSADSILYARHAAPERTERPVWGVLRGDVDNFLIRLRRLQTIEEHLQLSLTYKQFFAGELTIRCSMPDFWQKVTILYTGGDEFAVCGDWDALLPLAREIQRVFHRFAEENLKDLPGPEGKTVTMAVALAPSPDTPLAAVYEEAGAALDLAKSSDKDCIFALGRILEWKQLSDAADLKDELTTLITRYGASPEYLNELCGLYRETAGTRPSSKRGRASERPWRYYRRLTRILPAVRDREGQKVRNDIITGFVGRNPAHLKLRPSGRVALEWARLSAGTRKLKSSRVRPPKPPRKPKGQPAPKPAEVVEPVAASGYAPQDMSAFARFDNEPVAVAEVTEPALDGEVNPEVAPVGGAAAEALAAEAALSSDAAQPEATAGEVGEAIAPEASSASGAAQVEAAPASDAAPEAAPATDAAQPEATTGEAAEGIAPEAAPASDAAQPEATAGEVGEPIASEAAPASDAAPEAAEGRAAPEAENQGKIETAGEMAPEEPAAVGQPSAGAPDETPVNGNVVETPAPEAASAVAEAPSENTSRDEKAE